MLQNLEAEKALLGCLLIDAMRLMPVCERHGICAEWFTGDEHTKVFDAIRGVAGGKHGLDAVDTLRVASWMREQKSVPADRVTLLIDDLANAAPVVAHGEYYADQVKTSWKLRMARSVMNSALEAIDRQQEADSWLTNLAAVLQGVLVRGAAADEVNNAEVMADLQRQWRDAAAGKKKAIGIEYPWPELTAITCGLEPGVTILAGRPSQGKTTIEDQVAIHAAKRGIGVGRITLDSSAEELLARAICREAGVSLPKLKFGYAGESNHQSVEEARAVLAPLPVWINDRDRELRGICAQIRAWHHKHKIGLVTIDFIQLIAVSEMGRSQWDANTRVSFVSTALKALSLELKVPFLVLSQLNRAVEKEGRDPDLSDLRDSGSLEQDAHKVIFVRKDAKVCKEMDTKETDATKHKRPSWIDVMKNKGGECGNLPFVMYPPYFRFEFDDSNAGQPQQKKQERMDLEDEVEESA